MKQIILILSTLFSLAACTRIAYKIQGAHPPELESIMSITAFCQKQGVDTNGMRIISLESFIENIQKNNSKDLLFDHNGILVNYAGTYENSACSQNIITTISSIISNSFLPRDSNITLQRESLKWRFLNDTSKVLQISPEGEDYTLVTYWNMYAGKTNHYKRFEKLNQAKKANPNIRFKHIYVNQDFRDDMGYELESKFGKKKKK